MEHSSRLTGFERSLIADLERVRSTYDAMVRCEGHCGGDREADTEFNRALNAAVKVINDRHRRRELGLKDEEDIAQ